MTKTRPKLVKLHCIKVPKLQNYIVYGVSDSVGNTRWPVDSREIFTIENTPKIEDRLPFFLVVILYKNYSGNFQSKRMKFTVLNS